jgi:hypothetical protein
MSISVIPFNNNDDKIIHKPSCTNSSASCNPCKKIKNNNETYESSLHTIQCISKNTLFGVIKYLNEPNNDNNKIISIIYKNIGDYANNIANLIQTQHPNVFNINDGISTVGYHCTNIASTNIAIQDSIAIDISDYILLGTNDLTNDILKSIFIFVISNGYTNIVFDQIQSVGTIEKITDFAKKYKNTYKTVTICYAKEINQDRLKKLLQSSSTN